ncbi:MAG TPA: methylated-DNA--[protein]-cysteine S-methyltransferase [Schlesneria sp.]
MDFYQDEFASPVGLVYVVSDGTNLRAIDFEGCESRMHRLLTRHYGQYTLHSARDPGGAVSRLAEYFAGDLHAIDSLPVATNGTAFQRDVWNALRAVPAGTTTSYGTIANRIGRPKACRAVGLANGSNPIALVVPCHRIVGSKDALTGYAGGLERKEWLLDHEGAVFSDGSRGLFERAKSLV